MAEKPSMITAFLSFLMKIGIFPLALQYFTVQDLKNTITQAGFTITHAENLADNPVSCFIAAKK
jgi:hypothetical protein